MTIRFHNESPFYAQSFKAKNAAVNLAVPQQEFDGDEKVFKYDVIVDGVVLDPMMIVRSAL